MNKFLRYFFGSVFVLGLLGSLNNTAQTTMPTTVQDDVLNVQEEATTPEAFIEVDPQSATTTNNGAYYITGKTSENCSQIVVEATNATEGVNDTYTLENYSYGDTTFKYGIKEGWSNLAEGTNNYTFTASCDGDQTKIASFTKTYNPPAQSYSNSGSTSDSINYYTNVDGNTVQSPTYYNSQPSGASAICGDGTYSFSQHRSGTCSHHGGVAQWL